MATYYAANAERRLNTYPIPKIDIQEDGGKIRQFNDTYTWLGTELNGDKLLFGRIPNNAMLIQCSLISRIPFFAAASSISVGWAQSVNGIESASTSGIGTAGAPQVGWHVIPSAWSSIAFGATSPGHFKTFSDETQVMLTLNANVIVGAAGGKLVVQATYVID